MALRRFVSAIALGLATAPAGAAESGLLYYMVRGEIDAADADEGTLLTWEAEAWAGYGDLYRLRLKSEGEMHGGRVNEAEGQLLASFAMSEFWNLQAGLRHDWEPASLTHAVIGVQGLAPYFFETEAALFVSEDGDVSARLEQSIDIVLTQRLIAEPHADVNVFARDAPELGVGAGLADVEAGVQLRYEITRKFAPYVDLTYERALGETAMLRRAAGEGVDEFTLRAGVRFWF